MVALLPSVTFAAANFSMRRQTKAEPVTTFLSATGLCFARKVGRDCLKDWPLACMPLTPSNTVTSHKGWPFWPTFA
jgi:hypothetical protein